MTARRKNGRPPDRGAGANEAVARAAKKAAARLNARDENREALKPPYRFPNSHRRHHDDEIVDEIHIDALPRYKTSGLSGDEWRVSYVVQIKRKGTVLFERHYSRLDFAVTHLPWVVRTMYEGGFDGFNEKAWTERIEADQSTCAQPGCPKPAVVYCRFKQIFAENGEGPLPVDSLRYFTGFCQHHSERGDCGNEDADDNYEIVSGSRTGAPAEDRRPSQFAGAVSVDLDDPESVRDVVRGVADAARGTKTSGT